MKVSGKFKVGLLLKVTVRSLRNVWSYIYRFGESDILNVWMKTYADS